MTTNKQRREQAREERRRLEAEQADAERRKRLIQYGAAAFFTAVVVVGVLIVVSQSGSDTGGDTTIEGADRIDAELAGLPQDGITLGDPKASVTITEYGDLQCPVCAAFADQVMPDLISNEIEPGNASIEFKNFNIIGPDSEDAAKAALAASKQGRYWQFIDLFYANQGAENSGYVTDAFLEAVAEGAGVADSRPVQRRPRRPGPRRAAGRRPGRGREPRAQRHPVVRGRRPRGHEDAGRADARPAAAGDPGGRVGRVPWGHARPRRTRPPHATGSTSTAPARSGR